VWPWLTGRGSIDLDSISTKTLGLQLGFELGLLHRMSSLSTPPFIVNDSTGVPS
jgi:hypothetical protein